MEEIVIIQGGDLRTKFPLFLFLPKLMGRVRVHGWAVDPQTKTLAVARSSWKVRIPSPFQPAPFEGILPKRSNAERVLMQNRLSDNFFQVAFFI